MADASSNLLDPPLAPADQALPVRRATRVFEIAFVAVVVVIGVALRAWNLHTPYLLIDEAESAINALSILEHGVPTDRYLGLPMFENTLTKPWPDSPEYEFKDTSY